MHALQLLPEQSMDAAAAANTSQKLLRHSPFGTHFARMLDVPALRLRVEFHLFLTALSVRPGSSLAITATATQTGARQPCNVHRRTNAPSFAASAPHLTTCCH